MDPPELEEFNNVKGRRNDCLIIAGTTKTNIVVTCFWITG
jgi:hypothetical protein